MNKLCVKSRMPEGIELKLDTSQLEFCNVVSMCIKQPHGMVYNVPDQFCEIVDEILSDMVGSRMLDNDYEDDKYCYLTIKKMYVNPRNYGNREGLHIDGFDSDQRNFIWFDSVPTCVCVGDFILTNDHDISLQEMKDQAEKYDYDSYQLDKNTLYELDQECVHEPQWNWSEKPVLRTFIKLTYSKELFNAYGNAWNYKLPHIKPTSNRAVTRNHGVINNMDHGVL